MAGLLAVSSPAFSYELDDVMARIEAREKVISTMNFRYEQEILFTAVEAPSRIEGQAVFAKNGRFKIEKTKPEQQIVISDGKTLTIYTPSFNQMWTGRWKGWTEASMLPKGLVPANDFVSDLKKNFDLKLLPTLETAASLTLSAVPQDEDAGYRLELLVSTESWMLDEIKYISESAIVKTRLIDRKVNAPVDESLFTLETPKGVEVISLN